MAYQKGSNSCRQQLTIFNTHTSFQTPKLCNIIQWKTLRPHVSRNAVTWENFPRRKFHEFIEYAATSTLRQTSSEYSVRVCLDWKPRGMESDWFYLVYLRTKKVTKARYYLETTHAFAESLTDGIAKLSYDKLEYLMLELSMILSPRKV